MVGRLVKMLTVWKIWGEHRVLREKVENKAFESLIMNNFIK